MKTIYFVRHGESQTNAGPVCFGKDALLTEKGRGQAFFTAKRVSKLPIQSIISSSLVRAKQTAEIINEKMGKLIEFSDLFIERKRPSVQIGVASDDPASVEAESAIWKNFCVPGYHHSDFVFCVYIQIPSLDVIGNTLLLSKFEGIYLTRMLTLLTLPSRVQV